MYWKTGHRTSNHIHNLVDLFTDQIIPHFNLNLTNFWLSFYKGNVVIVLDDIQNVWGEGGDLIFLDLLSITEEWYQFLLSRCISISIYMNQNICSIFWVTVLIRLDRRQTFSLCTTRLSLFSPSLLSSTFDANYTICPPFVSRDRTMSVFSLLTFTHCWIQTYIHVQLFAWCATMPLTIL